ncbi:MAG: asparagine synthase (glutamine-hydrolyzing) [Desulfuromonas sp.]|nr:MAG: asparagine synthase (glutamine-hydrolyzing) [Desulfuromonas sp.]
MCGIAGYLGKGSVDLLEAMSAAIAHRGPDDHGYFTAEGVGLAHRRLSVIDLSPAGHQPMISPEGEVLVFNGEIYNFREIRAELETLGHVFTSQSDSEVILRAYRQWGDACPHRFRGMFAFALWDADRRRLFAVRDRAGIKPFYYLEQAGDFYFASEAKALLAVPGFARKLNRDVLPFYLTFRYTPGADTLFAGIRKLPPGHSLSIEPGSRPQISRYWSLNFEPDDGPDGQQWQERFWGTFEEAVRLRLISDVPVGTYLSGGLDSSLIVAAMTEVSGRPVDAFSVGFRDGKADELPYARLVAEQFGCRHHVLHTEEAAAGILDAVTWHLDEPVADLATLPTFLMAQATKPHVSVVLSGEGADEILAGYPKYRAMLWGRRSRRLLPSTLWGVASRLAGNLTLQRVFASQGENDPVRAYLALAAVFTANEQKSLLTSGIADTRHVEPFVRGHFSRGADPLSNLLALDFHTWLPDDLPVKNDRMTIAHAVEARVPYLDHKLVELCARIPSRYKVRWFREKVLLRQVMADKLPPQICRRKKTGFTVPLQTWYVGELKSRVDRAFDTTLAVSGLFRPDALDAVRRPPLDHPYGRRQFWTLAALALWMERFEVG